VLSQARTRLEGGCFCGAVRFELDDAIDAGYCHCSICRRMSGAPAVAWLTAAARDLRITRGEPKAFASSPHWVRLFCPACGAPVYQRQGSLPPDGSGLVCVLIPSLDRPEAVRPTAHIWCSSRLPFFEVSDDLPRFQEGQLTPPETRQSWRAGR
jgi:hypothetical protein